MHVILNRGAIEHADDFKLFLSDLIKSNYKKIIINPEKLNFIDSAFLGAIVLNLKKAAGKVGDLRLVSCHCQDSVVYPMFEANSMNKVFKVFPDVESAVKSF